VKVTAHPQGWSASLPPDEAAVLLRPGGTLARSKVKGVTVDLYRETGALVRIPAEQEAALLRTDPYHVADLTLLRQLLPLPK
jgi:hypothetical protein